MWSVTAGKYINGQLVWLVEAANFSYEAAMELEQELRFSHDQVVIFSQPES